MSRNLKSFDLSDESDLRVIVEKAKNSKTTYRNLTLSIKFRGILVENPNNIFYKYKDLIEQNLLEVNFDESYHYKPEKLSRDLYSTTDLSFLLLWINGITNSADFKGYKLKIFDPLKVSVIIDIIDKFQSKLKLNRLNPQVIGDLTIKKVIV